MHKIRNYYDLLKLLKIIYDIKSFNDYKHSLKNISNEKKKHCDLKKKYGFSSTILRKVKIDV